MKEYIGDYTMKDYYYMTQGTTLPDNEEKEEDFEEVEDDEEEDPDDWEEDLNGEEEEKDED